MDEALMDEEVRRSEATGFGGSGARAHGTGRSGDRSVDDSTRRRDRAAGARALDVLTLLAGVSLLVSIPVLSWAANALERSQAWIDAAHRTEGVVLRLVPTGTDRNLAPVYRFTPDGGEPIEQRSPFASSPPYVRAGETVGVLYHPHNPNDARLDTPLTRRGLSLVGAVAAGVWFVGSLVLLVLLFWLRRRASRERMGV